jgi:hypothetical protein
MSQSTHALQTRVPGGEAVHHTRGRSTRRNARQKFRFPEKGGETEASVENSLLLSDW